LPVDKVVGYKCLIIITSAGLDMQHKSGKCTLHREKYKFNFVGLQMLGIICCVFNNQGIT